MNNLHRDREVIERARERVSQQVGIFTEKALYSGKVTQDVV